MAAAMLASAPAAAESLDDVLRAELAPALGADLGISEIHLSPAQAQLDVRRDAVDVEVPREVRAGRQSIKLTLRGKHARVEWVPVSFGKLAFVAVVQRPLAAGAVVTAADVTTERRAPGTAIPVPVEAVVGAVVNHDLTAGAIVANHDVSLPPPLARGTQVTVDVRRGSVHIHGTGVLELAARPGQPATALIEATHAVIHGVLVAPNTLVVGEAP